MVAANEQQDVLSARFISAFYQRVLSARFISAFYQRVLSARFIASRFLELRPT
jgi:hypothetical protein